MYEEMIAQYQQWSQDSPVAGGLLRRDGDAVKTVCLNSAFHVLFDLADGTADQTLDLPALLENPDGVRAVLAGGRAVQWVRFSARLNGYLSCKCRALAPGLCQFWIQFDHDTEKEILDELPVGILRFAVKDDVNGAVCTYANRRALEINGFTRGCAPGQTGWDFRVHCVHPEDLDATDELLTQFTASGLATDLALRILRPDGGVRWVSGVVSWVSPGQVCQMVYQDVTERKASEQRENKTRNLLEKIFSTTQTAIFWKDADRRFLGANRAFLAYYGFPSEAVLLGKNDEEMGWHTEPDPYKNDELRVIRQGISTTRVPGRCLSHGEERDIVASKSPLYENGKIVGLVGSFEDVTRETRQRNEISRLNVRLAAALSAAEKASRAKSDFLARMSHDMRTPLTTVLGLCDLAADHCRDPELQRYFHDIRASAAYLQSLLSDILDVQRLASGKLALEPSVCSGAATARAVESILRPLADQKQIRFQTTFQCSGLTCYPFVDTRRTQQILINLLSNAIKYTQPGGTVEWTCTVGGETEDGFVVTHVVRDNGPGISPAFQAHMYEPFTQEQGNGGVGSGLGLAIVKRLVELMHGTIACDSAPGKGTAFTLTLPHGKASEAQIAAWRAAMQAAETPPHAIGRVLICEDNEVNARILAHILLDHGIESDRAGDGAKGVEMAQSRRYAAILMDIRMPVMDGFEAARRIRRFDAAVPVIALSANSFPEDVQKSKDAGMNEHLSKPIEVKELLETLARLTAAQPAGGPRP